MPKRFLVGPLPADHVDQAFPLVQPLPSAATPERWRALAAPFAKADPARGIIACRMGSGHIRGLFCYALDESGVLRVGPFAVAGLFDVPATAEGLIEAIGQTAQRLNAGRVAVDRTALAATAVPHCDPERMFAAHGYRADGDALVRDGVAAEAAPVMATA